MKNVITLSLLFLLSGCGIKPYVKGDIGYARHDWWGWVDTAHLSVGAEKRVGDHTVVHCQWTHVSNPSRGFPFNDEYELISYEFPNCGLKIGGVR